MIVVINKKLITGKNVILNKQIFNIFVQPANICDEWLLKSEKKILLIGPNENH